MLMVCFAYDHGSKLILLKMSLERDSSQVVKQGPQPYQGQGEELTCFKVCILKLRLSLRDNLPFRVVKSKTLLNAING